MAPSSLRNRTPRYGDFINGVLLVLTAGVENFNAKKIAEIYSEMVERSDLLENQINSYRVPGEVDGEGKQPYQKLSVLITDYITYHRTGATAEWITKSGLTDPRNK